MFQNANPEGIPILFPTQVLTGITAYAGGGITNAVSLSKGATVVGTVATNADSVKLPAQGVLFTLPDATTVKRSEVGAVLFVRNAGAATLAVFPATSSGTINGGSAGASVSIATLKTGLFICTGADTWLFMLGA